MGLPAMPGDRLMDLRSIRRSDAVRRLGLVLFLTAAGALAIACAQASREWIGRPFGGFLLTRQCVVLYDGLGRTPATSRIPEGMRLVAVGGTPVESAREALAAFARHPPGSTVMATFRHRVESKLPIRVVTFTAEHYLAVFGRNLLNGLGFLVMGTLVTLLRPRLPAAWAMFAFGAAWGIGLVTVPANFTTFALRPVHVLGNAAAPFTLVSLALCFPVVRRRHRTALGALSFGTLVLAGLDVGFYRGAPTSWPQYAVLWRTVTAACGVLALGILWRQYRAAGPVESERIRLLLLVLLVTVALPAGVTAAAWMAGSGAPVEIFSIGAWLLPAGLAFVIVRREPLSVAGVVRQSISYLVLSAAILLVYAGGAVLLALALADPRVATSPWFLLLFAVVVTVLGRPLWDRLQRGVEAWLYQTGAGYAETIESVSDALTRTLDTEEITARVRHAVSRAMGTARCRLFVRSHGEQFQGTGSPPTTLALDVHTRGELAAGRILRGPGLGILSTHIPTDTELLLPVCFGTDLEGFITLSPKKLGSPYGARDLELLRTLANQTAIALRNARSYHRVTELLASLEQRVEERTRELQSAREELHATNERLRELDRLKTQFFSDASHELRSPITLVLGPLEELRTRNHPLPPEARRMIDVAYANASRLLVLTDTLLDLSRLDAGRLQPEPRVERLGELLERIVEPFRWAAEQRSIALRFAPGEDIAVRCDPLMVHKIAGNLLANALKFTEQGEVVLHLGQRGDEAYFRVTDTGPGIPADELPQVFERYRQGSTALRAGTGSGIGLALVRELSELQGGRVEAESEPGVGSSFTVWLPAADRAGDERIAPAASMPATSLAAAAAPQAEISVTPTLGEGDQAPSALIVDDNPDMLEFLRSVLADHYRVSCTANTAEALEIARHQVPDIIVSDVMMPGPDGIALCETIKSDERLTHVPLILLTARSSLESKLSGLEAGADDYLTKPFHPQELEARMANLLRQRSMERELRRTYESLQAAYEELQRTQAQLVQSEKMASLGTLVAGLAHEINNPVSFTSSSIELIIDALHELRVLLESGFTDESPDPERYRRLRDAVLSGRRFDRLEQNAAICRDGAQRAARIVRDLRQFSRPSHGERQPTDLNECLDRTLRLVEGECRRRIRIERDYAALPPVLCDVGQVNQVFLNLLGNAIQAIPKTGTIRVHTARDGHDVRVCIEDSGEGMNEETQRRIFDPFFTTRHANGGTGLGLSIVRSLVRDHGGDIRVSSALGKGTSFTVTFPIGGGADGSAAETPMRRED